MSVGKTCKLVLGNLYTRIKVFYEYLLVYKKFVEK